MLDSDLRAGCDTRVIYTCCRVQSYLHHEAVMAVDSGRCRALLARSLTSQSVPIELVKVYLFSLCSEPVVLRPD